MFRIRILKYFEKERCPIEKRPAIDNWNNENQYFFIVFITAKVFSYKSLQGHVLK